MHKVSIAPLQGMLAMALVAALGWGAPARAEGLTLYNGTAIVSVVHDNADGEPLTKAAALLAHDLTVLTGNAPKVVADTEKVFGSAVIAGRMDAPLIAALIKANTIDTSPIAGKWEAYGRVAIPAPWNPKVRALLIFGSDTRGAIWGIVDLTREMGVSAWEWWADVTPRKVDRIRVKGDLFYSREPSVKYRAIFLNDEDFGLRPWAAKTYDPECGDICPKTYARVFELMWRLKANVIWPAMHKGTAAFDQVPGNAQLASDYAIIHASSHAEPMLRNNDREWDVKTMGPFNWLSNKESVIKYWDDAVEAHKQFENIYTVGMRGIGDYPMVGVSSAEQTKQVLSDVVGEQRKMLVRVLGKPAGEIPQAFTPYKEVLLAYGAGLKLPDDIMLTWPDDNFGYIRHLPDAAERVRPGGSGVYYHISYWGSPASYLWLATTHPALMWEEMNKAYRFDARKIWILNVGDIKPGEYLAQLFLDMAFDAPAFGNIVSVRAHLKDWMANNIDRDRADQIANVMWSYYDLAFSRKPEFMGFNETYPPTVVRQTDYNLMSWGDENARRLDAYDAISERAATLTKQVPADRKDAFFELVGYPVAASAAMNARALDLDKAIAYGLQRRASANVYAERAKAAQTALHDSAVEYDTSLAGGKWGGMMDIAPARLPVYDDRVFPAWSASGDAGCGLQAEGGVYFEGGSAKPALPLFHREVPESHYLDMFETSPITAHWTAQASTPWIKLDRTSGSFDPKTKTFEQRLEVSIDWKNAPDNGIGSVTVACDTSIVSLPIGVRIAPRQERPTSFIEVDKVVSIYATNVNALTGRWEPLEKLGHTGASLRTALDMTSVKDADIKDAPSLIYRFTTTTEDDLATLKAYLLPTLPVTPENGMRIALSIDGGPPTVLDLATAEFSQAWRHNVLTNSAVGVVPKLKLAAGTHTLTVYALDPGEIFDRFEIAFAGAEPAYDPVPETRIPH